MSVIFFKNRDFKKAFAPFCEYIVFMASSAEKYTETLLNVETACCM